MPRQARIVFPGYLHHVTQRGNYQQKVFQEDQDCAVYLRYINKYSKKYAVDIFAYCLMHNHVHFIVRPNNKESLASAFNGAHQRYAYYYHKKIDRNGHLWQARFFSCILHGDHIPTAIRYVEKNPVRAGMVKHPWEYKWSSVHAHLGKKYKIIRLANINEVIQARSWKSFVAEDEMDQDVETIRNCTYRGYVVGPKSFIKFLEKKLCRKLLPKGRGRPKT